MKLAELQIRAPMFLLTIAPATLLGYEIFKSLEPKVTFWPAIVIGTCVGIGLELLNGASTTVSFLAYSKEMWGHFRVGLAGIVAYVLVTMVTIYAIEQQIYLALFFLLSPIAFIPFAISNSIAEKEKVILDKKDDEDKKNKFELDKIKAETSMIKAKAKLVEAENGTFRHVPALVPPVPVSLELVPQSKEEFRELYRNSPEVRSMTSSELAEYLPVGERAARKWIAYAKNGHND